jgi:hypothetical protein
MSKAHTFHIPVMGIGFTIDTPLKVSQFGIDSVISLVDDILVEKIRKMYCEKLELPYKEITNKIDDFRAKRITSYLNLINSLAEQKIDKLRNSTIEMTHEIKEYFSMLPDSSTLKSEFKKLTSKNFNLNEIGNWLKENISMGSIDVNIMTKIDKVNYDKDGQLPIEYNDAFAAVRGYAKSDLKSGLVLSAGMHPRLYGYMENFEDFYPDENGYIKKKIILKVSDYRSALIQGRFFAKKGLWVSEYRIESGLNCGGHAFATDGYLMGPILAEFKEQRERLPRLANDVIKQALQAKNRVIPEKELKFKITAQGGVGTTEEHEFLMDHYGMDSVGWGSPFLLVPEVTNVDKITLEKLQHANEDDLFVSRVSPLGVRFNNLKGNTKDVHKFSLIEQEKPGSNCPKGFLVSNNEFSERAICTASRRYQKKKIEELNGKELSVEVYNKEYEKITDKSCLCVGLGTPALLVNNIDTKIEGDGVSVCPGPNIAYYSKELSLKQMIDHIYGRANVITSADRPNMFVKELNIYLDFLKEKLDEVKNSFDAKQEKYFLTFSGNIEDGINYYQDLFIEIKGRFDNIKTSILSDLDESKEVLQDIFKQIEKLSVSVA